MDAEKNTVASAPGLDSRICSSFPALDPNGQPLSMVLRGAAADLGDLRSVMTAHPDARLQLGIEMQEMNACDDKGDKFEDVDVEGMARDEHGAEFQGGDESDTQLQAEQNELARDEQEIASENKKRSRDDGIDGEDIREDEDYDDDTENHEQLLFYHSSVQYTCSSWNMENVSGDMFVTSLRVLFLSAMEDDDLAIDGSCIALHAVDSLPGENDEAVSHHVYCQLAEPMGDDGDVGGYTSAISMFAPTQIAEENGDEFNREGDDRAVDEDERSEEISTVELYLKPTRVGEVKKDDSADQCNTCQKIFDSLTKLASLNPVEDSDGGFNGGGGLFSMLSLMAGIDSNGVGDGMVIAGHEDESDDDDLVVRLGGSNNLVETDDNSEGAAEGGRQAMLQRLDNMLVVPSQYEIESSDDGQFDDAEEGEDDDAEDVDAIL